MPATVRRITLILVLAFAGCPETETAPADPAGADAPAPPTLSCRSVIDAYTYSADGSESSHHQYATEYDAEGHPIVAEIDYSADGVVDQTATSVWRDAVRVTVDTDWDDDPDDVIVGVDGTINQTDRYTYDDAGQLVTVVFDESADGIDDAVHTLTWRDNLLRFYAYDNDNDGHIDESDRYTYTSDGDVSTWLFEGVNDTSDLLATYSYDAPGQIDTVQFFQGAEFVDLAGTHTWTWDASGTLVRVDVIWLAYGFELQQTLTYTWGDDGYIQQVDLTEMDTRLLRMTYAGDCAFGEEPLLP